MNTDDLIGLLSKDISADPSLGKRLTHALGLAIMCSALLLLATVGVRPDLISALGTARVLFKISFTFLLAASACAVAFRVGVPGLSLGARARLLVAPLLLLVAGIAVEALALPEMWEASLVGRNAAFCVFFIPVLSLAPLVGLLWALRSGAPESPGLAGAVAGLAAGGLAAALYALHCPDDSPLFVAAWYTIAVASVSFAGWLAGRRLLRW